MLRLNGSGFFLDSWYWSIVPSKGIFFRFLDPVYGLLPDFRRWMVLPDFSDKIRRVRLTDWGEKTYEIGKERP